MAQNFEIVDAFRREFNRDPTGDELSRGAGLSVGQLNDAQNLRRLAGVQTSEDVYNESLRLAREAAQPAINTLQSQIPSTEQAFQTESTRLEGTKQPLQARYENIINQIVQRQQVAEGRQTVATKNELGRRGVSSLSGIGAQEVVNAVNPITQEYSGLLSETSSDRESAIGNIDALISQLGLNKTNTLNSIASAIAQLQAGAGGNALQLTQSTIQNNTQKAAQDVANQIAMEELKLKQAGGGLSDLEKLSLINVGGQGYAINPYTGEIVNTFGGGGGTGTGSGDFFTSLEDLAKQFGG